MPMKVKENLTCLLQMLRKPMQYPSMHGDISGHMQSLLHESIMVARERGLERSLCRTPILTPMSQEKEEEGLVMMHKMGYGIPYFIQRDAL